MFFGGGGPLPGPLGAPRDMYLSGVGDHFQILKVSEGTCTVLLTYLFEYLPTYLPSKTKQHRARSAAINRQYM